MKVHELISDLTAMQAAGFGDREVVISRHLAYERVTALQYVTTIYRGQNPDEIPEPLVVIATAKDRP